MALWDTLMPQRRSLVESYAFHDSGASALLFAPQRYQMVTAGKKGQVAVWDIRQHRQLHAFKAHDHPIKCLALDPNEDFFVTGSVDGDIKVKFSLLSITVDARFKELFRHPQKVP